MSTILIFLQWLMVTVQVLQQCCWGLPSSSWSNKYKGIPRNKESFFGDSDDDGSYSGDKDFYDEFKSELDERDRLDDDSDFDDERYRSHKGISMDEIEFSEEDADLPNLSSSTKTSSTVGGGCSKDEMYAAYNELHNLAQAYSKDFDAPAVVVVGHQSSGKSALIEALMGFQFNQVGGGTKTRRPIALRMQFHPDCDSPKCYLTMDNDNNRGKEEEKCMTLKEIQNYIESENRRLERDPLRSFDAREIRIRVEYKHCPNMILIDTPGLISASDSRNNNAAARALRASAKEAERLVVDKLSCRDYFIVCVEDTVDWKHSPTRSVVQKADPEMHRTVVVNTKLDTKLPQLNSNKDVVDFLKAKLLEELIPSKLGGPYFTSVPSGRVGRNKLPRPAFHTPSRVQYSHDEEDEDEDEDEEEEYYQFSNDNDFVRACRDAETNDRSMVYQRLFRSNINNENSWSRSDRKRGKKPSHQGKNSAKRDYQKVQGRIGIQPLRDFLEKTVDDTYRQNMARIIPLLQNDYSDTEKRLMQVDTELASLSIERLKAGADAFCDDFCVALRKAIQGSITAPASLFGETLQQEKTTGGGSFSHIANSPMSVSDRTWDRLVETEVGHASHRLYGGAQYHRTLREFHLATKCMRTPSISEDEIANAAGMGTTHDGMNFLHAACVIALEKARRTLEPMLDALQHRVSHVFDRLCPVTEYMLKQQFKSKSSAPSSMGKTLHDYDSSSPTMTMSTSSVMDISQNPQFRRLIRKIFERFVAQVSETTMEKCRDDLIAITRYVTWNLEDGTSSAGALRRALPDQTDLVAIYQVALQANDKTGNNGNNNPSATTPPSSKQKQQHSPSALASQKPLQPVRMEDEETRDYYNLLQVMEEAISSRNRNRTNMVVGSLVQHIVSQWRESFARQVATKFNCYFMLPFVDDFHKHMRQAVQQALNDGDGGRRGNGGVFDLDDARRELQAHRRSLTQACEANLKLQDKFRKLERMMRKDNDSTRSQDRGI